MDGWLFSLKMLPVSLTFYLLHAIIGNVMWSLTRSTSRGGFSVRSIFTHALTALVAVLLLTIFTSSPTHAADASWSGNAITYGGNTYNGPVSAPTIKDLSLFEGVKAYTYVDPAPSATSPSSGSSSSSNSPPRQIHVIYFLKDVDTATATSAKYRTYTYVNKDTFTNGSNPEDIGIESQSTATSAGTSSCSVDSGVGWWICPITNFLASGMDKIFDILAGFLAVQPPQTGQDNSLYRAWSYMRSIANVAFVIAFLIIIYSQISNMGVSSYGIKKLLPRLIVAALLVNVSYLICSVAIDISNILGYSVQDIFINIRNSLVGGEGNGYQIASWESVSGFVLSGGTAATAGLVGGFVTLTDFGVAGTIFLLLPAVVAGLVAIVVALFIMAARQAIIIIFVVISPLAFVAYLLPNTEKWFEKWRETFMTMLVLFPAFSVVFGGSQLAGTVIIQNANSINLVILGMMVQVAPLFITPLLIRFGGGLIGKIAGLANNPQKGLVDRTRNFTKDRTENLRTRRLGNGGGFLRSGARWRDGRRRYREGRAGAATSQADARWANDRRFQRVDQLSREAADKKSFGETLSENRYGRSKLIDSSRQQLLDIDLRNAKGTLANTNQMAEVQFKNIGAKNSADRRGVIAPHLASRALIAQNNAQMTNVLARQIHSAEHLQQQDYQKALAASEDLRKMAGGIDIHGADSALAAAVTSIREAYGKNVAEARAINKHFNLSSRERQAHATGGSFSKTVDGATRTFDMSSIFTQEAAIEDQMTTGTVDEVEQLIGMSGKDPKTGVEGKLYSFRTTISEALAKNPGMQAKAFQVAGQSIDDIAQGLANGDEGLDFLTARAIARGKLSEKDIASLDPSSVRRFLNVSRNKNLKNTDSFKRLSDNDRAAYDANLVAFEKTVLNTFTGDERSTIKPGARPGLIEIARLLDPTFKDPNDES
jgi:hypothetical protein